VNSSSDRYGKLRGFGRKDCATGGTGGGAISGRISSASTKAVREGLARSPYQDVHVQRN